MTNQEIFEKVKAHLLAQNRRAEENGQCRFRTANGDKCAIGCLIPDHLYTPEIEQSSLGGSLLHEVLRQAGIHVKTDLFRVGTTAALLAALQSAHDSYAPELWPRELQRIARGYGFDTVEAGS